MNIITNGMINWLSTPLGPNNDILTRRAKICRPRYGSERMREKFDFEYSNAILEMIPRELNFDPHCSAKGTWQVLGPS
jgi:hypothetical protein